MTFLHNNSGIDVSVPVHIFQPYEILS